VFTGDAFHGQTSWQMSQPKTLPASRSDSDASIAPRCSIVK